MEYLTTEHADVNFQFINYFSDSVKVRVAGTNHRNGFRLTSITAYHSNAIGMQRSNRDKQHTAPATLTHLFTH